MSDLAKRVAELFSEEPWKHNEDGYKANACMTFCTKCKLELYKFRGEYSEESTMYRKRPCKHPDPIDITDLGKALECFRGLLNPRGAMALVKYIEKLLPDEWKVYTDSTKQLPVILTWFAFHATAEQIWEICCSVKESERRYENPHTTPQT